MACINPDGTPSLTARSILMTIKTPMTAEELSRQLHIPLFSVRSGLREMLAAGLIRETGNKYCITEEGKSKI